MNYGSLTWRLVALIATLALAVAACGPAGTASPGAGTAAPGTPAAGTPAAGTPAAGTPAAGTPAAGTESPGAGTGSSCEGAEPGPFFDQAECEEQLALRDVTPEGPDGQPWAQYLEPDFVDTADWAMDGEAKVCFSNAGVNNPWRVVGFETMNAEVDIQRDAGEISELVHVDAGGDDAKQIADIQDLVSGGDCDALIVSPNTTAALTPAVESACAADIPVIVFDRGVNTDCQVTFIKPIGGYAFGADAAEYIVSQLPEGGNVLALRILPGVDVLETRFSAAKAIFSQNNIELLAPSGEFTDGDPSKTKQIVSDYLARGDVDAIWMDAGATSLGAIEAFEDAGLEVPPITGEDQQDFLQKWSDDGLSAVAPTYPTYQWRTAIIATVMVLNGEQVPANWNLPQPLIDESNLAQYLQPDMPPLHYALCGCEEMPDFPERWQNVGQ